MHTDPDTKKIYSWSRSGFESSNSYGRYNAEGSFMYKHLETISRDSFGVVQLTMWNILVSILSGVVIYSTYVQYVNGILTPSYRNNNCFYYLRLRWRPDGVCGYVPDLTSENFQTKPTRWRARKHARSKGEKLTYSCIEERKKGLIV